MVVTWGVCGPLKIREIRLLTSFIEHLDTTKIIQIEIWAIFLHEKQLSFMVWDIYIIKAHVRLSVCLSVRLSVRANANISLIFQPISKLNTFMCFQDHMESIKIISAVLGQYTKLRLARKYFQNSKKLCCQSGISTFYNL